MRNTALLSVICIGCAVFLSFINTEYLYKNWKIIDSITLSHPEFLPDTTSAIFISAGNTTSLADTYWIRMIQYIGSTGMDRSYQRYIPSLVDLITDLHPRFTSPYTLILLLTPDADKVSKGEFSHYMNIGKKGVENTCSEEKINAILKISNLNTLWDDPSLENPCLDGMIPYLLAYHEFYDNHDPAMAKKYYTIASMNADTPPAVRLLIPLMDGKEGFHRSSAITFLTLAEGADDTNEVCHRDVGSLLGEDGTSGTYTRVSSVNSELIRTIAKMREEIQVEQAHQEDTPMQLTCSDYFDRAIRQIHMDFLDQAQTLSLERLGKYSTGMEALFDAGIISIIPEVPGNETHTVYDYNPETHSWDIITSVIQEASNLETN